MSNTCGRIGAMRPGHVLDVPLTATMRPRSIAVSAGGGRSCALSLRLQAGVQRVEVWDGQGAHAVEARLEAVDVSAAPLAKRTP